MLDCQDDETKTNANCKHCQGSGDNNQQRYWDIQLDQDLLETICNIYPEWFKNCSSVNLGETNGNTAATVIEQIKIKQEESSKQKTVDKNKESHKSHPSFHESRQKSERSKMGDILKHKIQKRPDRQEILQQHILEDSSVESNAQEQQRQMKRARLADGLNERLDQRAGPLELVKVNILHADEILAQAVRDGNFTFRSLCDTPSPQLHLGLDDDCGSDGAFSPSPPYDCNEHSQGSLPSLDANEPSPNPLNQGSPFSAGAFSMSPPSSASSPLSVLTSVVSPQSAQEQILDYMVHMHQQQHNTSNKEPATPNKNSRKKSKPKTQPKTRTIKFHEYKGPPNAQKTSTVSASNLQTTEPSYDLLLQQQQLQLQWQLEWLQKNPQAVLHTPQKRNGDQIMQVSQKPIPTSQSPQQQQQQFPQQQVFDVAPASPQKLLSKLEDMKVSDLKTELKKRNLPVSGSKPTLIERLKSYTESPQSTSINTSSINCSNNSTQQINVSQLLDNLSAIPTSNDVTTVSGSFTSVESGVDTIKSLLTAMSPTTQCPTSVISLDLDCVSKLDIGDVVSDSSSTSFTNEDIVQLQQRFIEKLQRELERSQQQLQQSKQSIISQPNISAITSTPSSSSIPGHPSYSDSSASNTLISSSPSSISNGNLNSDTSTTSESKSTQRQLIHQYLQQKIQHQRLMQEVQQKQAQIKSLSSSLESSTSTNHNANSTLTALLERQPMNASTAGLDVVAETVTKFANTGDRNRDSNSVAVNGIEDYTVLPMQHVKDEADSEIDTFPGVIPLDNVVSDTGHLEFDVVSPLMMDNIGVQTDSESVVMTAPNSLSSRSASLPSFSNLLSCKPAPTRSNTDSQFVITKPPPDYNEATRHLKVKQQLPPNDESHRKVRKSSLKSQAVDDVLEILIKNGELPPSAAQELSTRKSEQSSIPNFSTNGDVYFSKPMTTTSLMTTPQNTSMVKDGVVSDTSDLHMSLQSVLELTPPSSAGFGDTSSAPTSSLDFDFSLDMPEIESMDLDNLENPQVLSGNPDNTVVQPSAPIVKESKASKEFVQNIGRESSSQIVRAAEPTDIHERAAERNIDMDLIQWLEVFGEYCVPSSSSNTTNFHQASYRISNDRDPFISTSARENLELFSSDDIDFSSQHDLNGLSWGDRTDFTV